jgi:DNA primase
MDHIYLVEGYMDVVGLSKNGIDNAVANLGTSLTDKQILTLNQFFDDIIICFDGDESGYKAALRAAENSIKELKPEKNISFLFLPDKEDPDSYVNKNGKANFIDFTKQSKLSIHQFIFSHYKKQTANNPSSLAIFEKKLRNIASTIKDDFIKKYVLEYFLEKIAELTPHSNQNKKKFFVKRTKSLDRTKKHFNDSQSLTGVELKEFSLLYLVMNNLNLLQANIHLIENIKLFTEVNKKIFELIIEKLKSGEQIIIEDLKLDNQLLEKINKFAPIKHILKNQADDDQKTIELLEDISRDLMNYDLEFRIQELESKFSVDMSETTFNELKELKKKQNLN